MLFGTGQLFDRFGLVEEVVRQWAAIHFERVHVFSGVAWHSTQSISVVLATEQLRSETIQQSDERRSENWTG